MPFIQMPSQLDTPTTSQRRSSFAPVQAGALALCLTLAAGRTDSQANTVQVRKERDPAAIIRQAGSLGATANLGSRGVSDTADCLMVPENGLLNPVSEYLADVSNSAEFSDVDRAAFRDYLEGEGRGEPAGAAIHVDFYDYDLDGDLDAFVGYKSQVAGDRAAEFDSPFRGKGLPDLVFFENVTRRDGETSMESPFPEGVTHFVPRLGEESPLGELTFIGNPAPVLEDLDEDGLPELYVGDANGNVRRYLINGDDVPGGEPGPGLGYFSNAYTLLEDSSPLGPRSPLPPIDVGENATPAFFDADGDGTLDLFVGSKLESEIDEPIALFYAGTPPLQPVRGTALPGTWYRSAPEENPFYQANVEGATSVVFADIDDDGDLDAFVGAKSGLHFFDNSAGTSNVPAQLTQSYIDDDNTGHPLAGAQLASPLLGEASEGEKAPDFFPGVQAPQFADIDGDGDLDFFAGNKFTVNFIENRGSSSDAAFLDMGVSPEYADMDGDGDLDVIAGGAILVPADDPFDGFVRILGYFENVGTPTEPVWERSLLGLGDIDSLGLIDDDFYPDTIDIDDDGDLDLFVGTDDANSVRFFENVGDPQNPVFEERTGIDNPFNDFNNVVRGDDPFVEPDPYFGDLDGDGDFDMVASDPEADEPQSPKRLRYFENVGSPEAPEFEERTGADNPFDALSKDAPSIGHPWLEDYDHDGDLDLFVGAKPVVVMAENIGDEDNPDFSGGLQIAYWLARTVPVRGDDEPGPLFNNFYVATPAVADIDGDGDFDGFIGYWGGNESFIQPGGLSVTPSSGVTSELGGEQEFSVVLTSQPLTDQIVDIEVSDTTEASFEPGPLTFTTENWDQPQIITVIGQDDALADGDVEYQVFFRSRPDFGARGTGQQTPQQYCAEVSVDLVNLDDESRATVLSATKTVTGIASGPGDTVTYTIIIRNEGDVPISDLMGPEFEDELPPEVMALSADASSPSVALMGNTVTYNGNIAPGGEVTITVDAEILADFGTTITNQGTVFFDGPEKGENNDAMVLTDDPALPGLADPTSFVVGEPFEQDQQPILEIPTLSQVGSWAMGALLALFAMIGIARTKP